MISANFTDNSILTKEEKPWRSHSCPHFLKTDPEDFGILRLIVSDVEKTKEVLSDNVVITQTKVIAARMSDEAGALKKILKVIQDTGVNIEYVYAFTSSVAGSAYVVLRVNDIEEAEAVLARNGIETLSDSDMTGLL